MFKINADNTPNVVRTFFSREDAVAYLVSEGATNGLMGWRRPRRDGEKSSSQLFPNTVFYTVRDERGNSITI